MDVALLECPVGDPIINHELWNSVDEQVVSLERKAVLEDNGFRIGQIGGITPARLQTLLTSEKSCVNPRRLFLHADNPTSLVLGPRAAVCQFELQQRDQPAPVSLTEAECTLSVTPSLTKDGRMRLQFTPQIRYGDKRLTPQAAPDGSGLMLAEGQPTKTYSTLAWELTLAPNQYLIVGARSDRQTTLGYRCFLRTDEPIPVQRLLVIRTSRTTPLESADDDTPLSRTPPLVLQAAWTKARGSCP
jgi:hypothetical protein